MGTDFVGFMIQLLTGFLNEAEEWAYVIKENEADVRHTMICVAVYHHAASFLYFQ